MLGIVLLYVGIVLINNGIARLTKIDAKSAAVMNIFTGALSVTLNILAIARGEFSYLIFIQQVQDYYLALLIYL